MDALILAVLGFFLTAGLILLFIRRLEAVIFWAALLAPAIGTGIINALMLYFNGQETEAIHALQFIPCFIAAIDTTFYQNPNAILTFVGIGYFAIWLYLLAHIGIKVLGIWALPIVPIIFWADGLTLQYFREYMIASTPSIAFLFSYMGLPLLILAVLLSFSISYLAWRRDVSMDIDVLKRINRRIGIGN